ncbi:MAG: endo alpha-1,4 polygalactosaminidase [Spirochaetes bacterium]|nr:endo alpha-1,4 polygalactosaminidase [Spirochaetota bacterium]
MMHKKLFIYCLLTIIIIPCSCSKSLKTTNKSFHGIRSWLYQLQNVSISDIAKSPYDLVVIDYAQDGSRNTEFSKAQILRIQNSGKIVLAYVSIGEAENYRFYWKKHWSKSNHPDWILKLNQDWTGNFIVKFWHPQWKKIIYNGLNSYISRIISAGFDGVYLDRIDTYRFWKKRGFVNAEKRMILMVKQISQIVRQSGIKKKYVFVQNAPELGRRKDYLDSVDGIGQESIFYKSDKNATSLDTRRFYFKYLSYFIKAGKSVLTVDYVKNRNNVKKTYFLSIMKKFIPFCSNRKLDTIPPFVLY